MPATFVHCCDDLWPVETVLEDHFADRRNNCEWTYELAKAMLEHSVAHPSNVDPSRISTTTLTSKCLRRQALERQQGYIVELSDLWPAFRGTMLHGQLEEHAHPASYGEVRFVVYDLGVQLPAVKKALPRKDRSFSGSPDLVDPTVGKLYDYKRTKEVPRFNTVWGDHIEQLNINRWLVDHADAVEVKLSTYADFLAHAASMGAEKATYDDERGVGVFPLDEPGTRARYVPVEWQELVIVYIDDKGPKPITVTKSIDVPAKTTGGTKKARVPDVWSDEQAGDFIAERYIQARLAFLSGTAPIPEGWEHQSHPLCNFCHVRETCAAQERKDEHG